MGEGAASLSALTACFRVRSIFAETKQLDATKPRAIHPLECAPAGTTTRMRRFRDMHYELLLLRSRLLALLRQP